MCVQKTVSVLQLSWFSAVSGCLVLDEHIWDGGVVSMPRFPYTQQGICENIGEIIGVSCCFRDVVVLRDHVMLKLLCQFSCGCEPSGHYVCATGPRCVIVGDWWLPLTTSGPIELRNW